MTRKRFIVTENKAVFGCAGDEGLARGGRREEGRGSMAGSMVGKVNEGLELL